MYGDLSTMPHCVGIGRVSAGRIVDEEISEEGMASQHCSPNMHPNFFFESGRKMMVCVLFFEG